MHTGAQAACLYCVSVPKVEDILRLDVRRVGEGGGGVIYIKPPGINYQRRDPQFSHLSSGSLLIPPI